MPKAHHDGFMLALLLAMAAGLGTALYYSLASRYLGVFLAGLCFCTNARVHHELWEHQLKRSERDIAS